MSWYQLYGTVNSESKWSVSVRAFCDKSLLLLIGFYIEQIQDIVSAVVYNVQQNCDQWAYNVKAGADMEKDKILHKQGLSQNYFTKNKCISYNKIECATKQHKMYLYLYLYL